MSEDSPDADERGADEGGPGDALSDAVGAVDDRLQSIGLYPIVKKEFVDSIRTRSLLVLAALYAIPFFLSPLITLYTGIGGDVSDPSTLLFLGQSPELASVLIPLTAIALSYGAISGERASGSLKLLLSQPYDRRDVVAGKVVGRFLSVGALFLGAVLLNTIVVLPEAGFSGLDWSALGVFVGTTLLLGLVFVAIGVGASAATKTTRRSIAVAGGAWLGLFLLWNLFTQSVVELLAEHAGLERLNYTRLFSEGSVEGAQYVEAQLFLKLLNPTQAYKTLLQSLTRLEAFEARANMFGGIIQIGQGSQLNRRAALVEFEEALPFFLSDGAAFAVLLVWIAVPLTVGYLSFRDADL